MNSNTTNAETIDTDDKVLYKKLSYLLNGIFFKVHNDLGPYCREHQYADAIEKELVVNSIPYIREYPIALKTDKRGVSNKADFLVDNSVLVELKAKQFVTRDDYHQTQRYLHAANLKLCLLVNFRRRYASIKRIIRIDRYL